MKSFRNPQGGYRLLGLEGLAEFPSNGIDLVLAAFPFDNIPMRPTESYSTAQGSIFWRPTGLSRRRESPAPGSVRQRLLRGSSTSSGNVATVAGVTRAGCDRRCDRREFLRRKTRRERDLRDGGGRRNPEQRAPNKDTSAAETRQSHSAVLGLARRFLKSWCFR